MLLRSLKRVLAATKRHNAVVRTSYRPEIVVLEVRATPANLTWVGAAGANWSAAASWNPAQNVTNSDTLIFGGPGGANTNSTMDLGGGFRYHMGKLDIRNGYAASITLNANLYVDVLDMDGGTVTSTNKYLVVYQGANDGFIGHSTMFATSYWKSGTISTTTLHVQGTADHLATLQVGHATRTPVLNANLSVFNQYATVNWQVGDVTVAGGKTVDNEGTILADSPGTMGNNLGAGGAWTFNNNRILNLGRGTIRGTVPRNGLNGRIFRVMAFAPGANPFEIAGGFTQDGANSLTRTESGTLLVTGAYTQTEGDLTVKGNTNLTVTEDCTLGADATLNVELKTPGSTSSQIEVGGDLALDGTLDITTLSGFAGDEFTLIDNQGENAVDGTFDGLPEGASILLAGRTYIITYVGGDGNDVVLYAPAQAPIGINNTVTTLEDTDYVFRLEDFPFLDPFETSPHLVDKVKIITLPGTGTLRFDGSLVSVNDEIDYLDIIAGDLVFDTPSTGTGTPFDSFTFKVRDTGSTTGGGSNLDTTARTMTVNVMSSTWVNDAPIGTDGPAGALENGTLIFNAGDFGFTDPNDSPANGFLAVMITTLPTGGVLTDNGVVISSGAIVHVSHLSGGLLVYRPDADANGTSYDSFTFQVIDNGGTDSSGVNMDTTARTMTINVTANNSAPLGADNSVATDDEETEYVFEAADFGFSDPNDSSPDDFNRVKIVSLPYYGTLLNNGVAVEEGAFVTKSAIDGDDLVFVPENLSLTTLYTGFYFQVEDDGGTSSGGANLDSEPKVMTIEITWVNDAPVGTSDTLTIDEDTPYTFTDGDFGFTDPNDTPGNGLLAVKITSLPSAGSLELNGSEVSEDQVIDVQDIIDELLVYTPAENGNGASYATIGFKVQDDGGGADLDATERTLTIDVTAVNDAPTGADNTLNPTPATDFFFNTSHFGFSDIDGNSFLAVKITSLPAVGSLWFYNGSSWTAVAVDQYISYTDISSGNFKYTPPSTGSPTFTFRVQDNGGGLDLDLTDRTMTLNIS